MTSCPDAGCTASGSRVGSADIPDWYELDWDHVERAWSSWFPPTGLDLVLEAATPVEENAERLRGLLAESM